MDGFGGGGMKLIFILLLLLSANAHALAFPNTEQGWKDFIADVEKKYAQQNKRQSAPATTTKDDK